MGIGGHPSEGRQSHHERAVGQVALLSKNNIVWGKRRWRTKSHEHRLLERINTYTKKS